MIDHYGKRRAALRDWWLLVAAVGFALGVYVGVEAAPRIIVNVDRNRAAECEAALSAAEEWRDIAIATGLNAVDRTDAILTDAFGAKYTRAAVLQQIMGVPQ